MLFLRPELLAPAHSSAPSLPGNDFNELVRIAQAPDWPGYFIAPKHATAAEGEARFQQRTKVAADYMWRIVEGEVDEREVPRYATTRPEASMEVVRAAAVHERAREERISAWLTQRREQ